MQPSSPADAVGEPEQDELARFFRYSHDVLTIMDRAGRVVVISPSVERVLGLAPKELVGERLIQRVHPEDQPDLKAKVRTLMEGRPVGNLDVRVATADGAWVPMRWSLSVGREDRVYGVGWDDTDRAMHREALVRNEMAELRLRTAMELHDGILQTLTGASLQIAVARRLLHTDPAAAEKVLEALGSSVAAEQQEMRFYVDELKGRVSGWTDGTRRLAERIEAALERVGTIWGVRTSVETDLPGWIGGEVGHQVVRVVQEAAVNAARHGSPGLVSVVVERQKADIAITISDDGQGFSFVGKYDDKALRENRLGPLSLKHRIREIGGSIAIDSTPEGATVFVRVPLPRQEEAE